MVRASIIRKLEQIEDPKLRDVLISFLEETERIIGETVTRREFQDFVQKTNENFTKVWEAINKLAEAQRKTEERLHNLILRVDELTVAHKNLEIKVGELAEAHKNLEIKVSELAEAHKNLEIKVGELAEAQKKTEEKLEKLIGEHRKTREQLGGLSNAFGYVLEDRAIRGLPPVLKNKFNIEVTEPLRRDLINIEEDRFIEVNLLGKGRINGKELVILGECKTQLRKSDIDKFLNYVKLLEKSIPGEKFLILVTYQANIHARKYASEKGLNLIFSYELPF